MSDASRRLIEVRPSRREGWTTLLIAGVFFALGLVWLYVERGGSPADPLMLAAGAAAIALLAFIWLVHRAQRVRLTDDTIERIDLFDREVRRLDRITAVRTVEDDEGATEVQVSGPGRQKPMVLPTYALRDPDVRAWVDGLSDPVREAFDRSRATLEADPRLGADVEARRRRLKRMGVVAGILNTLGTAACLWAVAYPRPYVMVIAALIVMPLIAIGLAFASGGRYALMAGRPAEARPSLTYALISPCLILCLRGWIDGPGRGGWSAVPPALGIALGLTAIAFVIQGRSYSSWAAAARMAAVLFAGAWGALVVLGLSGVLP